MKTIYIVTAGCYSDYGIRSVFSKKEDAEKMVNSIIEDQNSFYDSDEVQVEEWPVDAGLKKRTVYSISINENGEVVDRNTFDEWPGEQDSISQKGWAGERKNVVIGRSTRSFNVATKIARDKLAQNKAEKAGI